MIGSILGVLFPFSFFIGFIFPFAISIYPKLSKNPQDLAKLFLAVLPISIAERFTMLLLLIAVGVPLIIALKRARLTGKIT